MKITHATAKGGRYYQEDRLVTFSDDKGTFVAVADGHGSAYTSDYVATHIESLWKNASEQYTENRMLEVFEELELATREYCSGSTVSAAYIESAGHIYIAVLGDSPVALYSGNEAEDKCTIWVAPDHNVRTNDCERDAAIERGGLYESGYIWAYEQKDGYMTTGPGLQMGRALGDKNMGKVISHTPELFHFAKPNKGFLLLATDGVFDPAHQDPSEAVLKAIGELKDADAQAYVDRAIELKIPDNATAIMVKF